MRSERPANDDMVEGYLDGFKDHREHLPESLANRSASYVHGWLNGRDDRMRNPRSSARDLRELADEAMDEDDKARIP